MAQLKAGFEGCTDNRGEFVRYAGGQSKRTNVALALVSNPRVLFLDEPTSGLDSYTANEVMYHMLIPLPVLNCPPVQSCCCGMLNRSGPCVPMSARACLS